MTDLGDNGGAARGAGGNGADAAAPAAHARTVAAVLGEIVWLMSQSPLHKHMAITDLEWLVMPPILLQQFRMFYKNNPGEATASQQPAGVLLWGFVSDDVAERLAQGVGRMKPQDWRSGAAPGAAGTPASGAATPPGQLWVVEAIAPFGGAEAMVADLKAMVFPERELRFLATGADGRKEVRVV